MTTLAFFEGNIVSIAEAAVSITCSTLHYGTGCFGGLRAYWNEDHEQLYGFRLIEHYRRFLNSAKLLRCSLDFTPDQLRDITIELLSREGWRENVYIRPLAYKDDDIFKLWLHEARDKVAIFGHGGRGKTTQQLHELYCRVLRGEEARYMSWLTPVPAPETA